MRIFTFVKKHVVFCVAMLCAVVTSFLVPPDGEYLSYLDLNTLSCLFMTLAVVCALRNIKFFTIVARRLVMFSGTLRSLFVMLVVMTFLGSMLIANDMALITFLPLGYFALSVTGKEKYMAYLFVLQNISANLGGMLTPFGNPQNLYLYSYFQIPAMDFCTMMAPPFLLAILLLFLCCFLVPSQALSIDSKFPERLSRNKTVLYLALFFLSLLVVFRVVPFLIGLATILAVVFFVDRDALFSVDYPLLGTFFFFFIFAGNLSRLDGVNQFFSALLEWDPLLVSVFSCQIISNVPTAILLSRFTTQVHPLLLGVNIGGVGTIISSLASLITFSEFRILYPGHSKQYFLLFTVVNFLFLLIMTLAAKLIFLA